MNIWGSQSGRGIEWRGPRIVRCWYCVVISWGGVVCSAARAGTAGGCQCGASRLAVVINWSAGGIGVVLERCQGGDQVDVGWS